MKKLFLVLMVLGFLVRPAFAEPIKVDLPKLNLDYKAGVYYDFEEKQIDQTNTATILKRNIKIKDKEYGSISLDAGYTLQNKVLVGLSYRVGDLKNLGFDVPLSEYIDLSVGVAASYHYEREDLGFGIYATLIQVSF